jgi:hypothetical protein
MGNLAAKPMLQDLVKAAMVDSANRVRITEEARQQEVKTAGDKCAECGMEKHGGPCKEKHASAAGADGETVEKLASALDFLADLIVKEGTSLAGGYNLTEHLQSGPPGVSEATASKPLPDHKGQGVHIVPMHPGQQKAMKSEHGGTQMENTQDHAPELKHQMMQTNYGKKTGSVIELVRAKLAADEHEKKETEGMAEAKAGLDKAEAAHRDEPENKKEGAAAPPPAPKDIVEYMLQQTKVGEDAINPAQISAGAAVPPDTSAAGESGGEPVGGAPQGPTGLVGSSEAATNYTKGQAYANRKQDLGKYFAEPALSAEHDSVLRAAFDHTGQAGTKFGSAPADGVKTGAPAAQPASSSVKTAAARVLLSSLAASIDEKQRGGTTGTATSPGTVGV